MADVYKVPPVIEKFTGDYKWLSNFWMMEPPYVIKYLDIDYPSVEHAYQAAKSTDRSVRKMICRADTPVKAKMYGKHIKLRADWDKVKLKIMENLLRQKFSDPYLAMKLKMTQYAELIEGNDWGDTYWGMCNDKGENNLGKLLMQLRRELLEGNLASF